MGLYREDSIGCKISTATGSTNIKFDYGRTHKSSQLQKCDIDHKIGDVGLHASMA